MGDTPEYAEGKVPEGVMAVVDDQLWSIGRQFHHVLNLQTSLAENEPAWVDRMLGALPPFIHDVEKLLALLVTYALRSGAEPEAVARSMCKPLSNNSLWTTEEAQATLSGALGESQDGDSVGQIEAWEKGVALSESSGRERQLGKGLMHLLLLPYTAKYEADEITWTSERVRTLIRNGWQVVPKSVQPVQTAEAPSPSSPTPPVPRPKQESSASSATAASTKARSKTKKPEHASTS